MNRTYQGRVCRVEVATGEKDLPWADLPAWENALWAHPSIFQDAVNYYLVALAALAESSQSGNRLIQDLLRVFFRRRHYRHWHLRFGLSHRLIRCGNGVSSNCCSGSSSKP